jgi:rhodanese-related sulfurtransferase
MKLDIKNILIIVFLSSSSGLILNVINPGGIPLIKTSKKSLWTDSIKFKKSPNDSSLNISALSSKKSDQERTSGNMKIIKRKKADEFPVKGNTEAKEPQLIKLEQAFLLYKQNVIFLDARGTEEFKEGHIRNALNLPYYDFDQFKDVLNKIPKKRIIVTYCSGTDCNLSIMLGKQLADIGYKKIYIFFGGWVDWAKAGYPIESKKETDD